MDNINQQNIPLEYFITLKGLINLTGPSLKNMDMKVITNYGMELNLEYDSVIAWAKDWFVYSFDIIDDVLTIFIIEKPEAVVVNKSVYDLFEKYGKDV